MKKYETECALLFTKYKNDSIMLECIKKEYKLYYHGTDGVPNKVDCLFFILFWGIILNAQIYKFTPEDSTPTIL